MTVLLSVVVTVVVTSIITFYISMIARRKLPIAHNVAVIGFPRSGKTTLITALFAEIFSRRIDSISITPRGEETIKRVNDDIARLESGSELGPTTDQDLFAYRAEMVTGKSFFSRRYKIEIGDFPGEDSEELSNEDEKWLHELPYFKWVLNADAFIFVIDTEKIMTEKNPLAYNSNITSSFRAAWQKLKDHHYDGMRELKNKSIVLVFAKCDLLSPNPLNEPDSNLNSFFERNYTLQEEKLESGTRMITHEYADLIEYLKSETTKFKVVFSSSFAKNSSDGIRIGAKALLTGILPE